jgi:outer membrane protein
LKTSYLWMPLLACGLAGAAMAQAPTKVGIIHVQGAILATKDGQAAQQALQTKYGPRKEALDKKQAEMASMADQLNKGGASMAEAARVKLNNDIESLKKVIQRDGEDLEEDVRGEESKLMGDLGQKMYDVIIKYATQNGLAMVLDVTNPQGPILWADQAVNIGEAIVKLYDQAHPSGGTGAAPAATPPAAAKPPAAQPPAAAKPPAAKPPAPATKKQ